jgi:DNA-binding NtrC family response regulator
MDDSPDLARQVRDSLARAGGLFEIDGTGLGTEALVCAAAARAEDRAYALVFTAPGPPPARHGLQTLGRLREENPSIEVIVCGGGSDSWEEDLAVKLMHSDRCLFLKTPLEGGAARQLALFLAQKWSAARQVRLELEQSKVLLAAAEEARRAAQEQYEMLVERHSGLEAQLRQAQEMESVGQLAGGIAHDFNNLLTVISGHAGMLMAGPPASAKAADSLKEIAAAAKRASDLTRQLMTFSGKHELHPQAQEKSVPLLRPSGEQKAIGGAETILLVEDEAPLLKLMRHILESYGYKVLDSSTGKAALEIWGQHKKKIDLLLSDLILPGDMSGQELARVLQAEKPGLKVIYTSGGDPGRLAGDSPPAPGAVFIQKPFHARKLAETVFDTLRGK